MIPDEAVEALASVLAQEALVEADMAGYGWDAETDSPEQFMPRSRERAREYLKAAAPHLMAAAQRETVIEWGAAFKQTGNIYNYYRTREEAQAFVDSMAEVDAEMVVMTREVLPQSASEWRVHGA